ncbi:hypothetical protein MYCGRDRAFT_69789 [Ceraceosorus bombacis]|uniref:Uncharacterized protein n=1 Tax=Ceraceosorus bombacis TaxID=401625 RepID=A0A0P1BPV5_9BASI|nr:hypothetical protein MYCGRDRAFT_69789 [Ceraceosorus bombacis]
MKFSAIAVGAAAVIGSTFAQNATTPCSKYAEALFGASNGTTQLTLLTALVNTAVIGNYSAGAMNAVTGILNPGRTSTGEEVNLLGYFNGSIVSTNRGNNAVALNFLDGGGAEPLKQNKPANDNARDSNQYKLLTHLYQYFGALLGCSAEGFPAYQGSVSQSAVHRYMNLNTAQVTYFIEQVGAAATSFGVTQEDVTSVANTLSQAFNVRCAPAMKLPASAPEAYSHVADHDSLK